MKKDRNCGGAYPIYPAYPGMMQNPNMMPIGGMPNMGPVMPMQGVNQPSVNYIPQSGTGSSVEQQLATMNNQINSLERRVNNLEALVGNPTSKYNNSNYQVM